MPVPSVLLNNALKCALQSVTAMHASYIAWKNFSCFPTSKNKKKKPLMRGIKKNNA